MSETTIMGTSLEMRQLIDRLLDLDNRELYIKLLDMVDKRYQGQIDEVEYSSRWADLEGNVEKIKIMPKPQRLLLSVRGLEKRYSRFRLGSIDLDLYSGEIVGLVGENGNGKTTLLRMLSQDLAPTAGEIFYPAVDPKDLYTLRTQLTYIPQRTPNRAGKVRDNLIFCAKHYGVTEEDLDIVVDIWLLRFGMWSFRYMKWSELSSGYKMRFELIYAFLRKPQLMLIDEPLSNLDIVSQQQILDDLKMLTKLNRFRIGILLSSQQLYEVERVSDNVIFLKDGQPSYFREDLLEEELQGCVLEFESSTAMERIEDVLEYFSPYEIQRSMGNFYLEISKPSTETKDVLMRLLQSDVEIKYFRDVTHSTRRFFKSEN